MSDDQKKPPDDRSDVIERYQRKGGSARKDQEDKGGFWQRFKGRSARKAPRDQDRERDRDRIACELILPDNQRLLLLVRAAESSTGILQLRVEPPPANSPQVIKRLSTAGHGDEAPLEAPPPPTRSRPLTGPVQPTGVELPSLEPPVPTPPEATARPSTGPASPAPPTSEPPPLQGGPARAAPPPSGPVAPVSPPTPSTPPPLEPQAPRLGAVPPPAPPLAPPQLGTPLQPLAPPVEVPPLEAGSAGQPADTPSLPSAGPPSIDLPPSAQAVPSGPGDSLELPPVDGASIAATGAAVSPAPSAADEAEEAPKTKRSTQPLPLVSGADQPEEEEEEEEEQEIVESVSRGGAAAAVYQDDERPGRKKRETAERPTLAPLPETSAPPPEPVPPPKLPGIPLPGDPATFKPRKPPPPPIPQPEASTPPPPQLKPPTSKPEAPPPLVETLPGYQTQQEAPGGGVSPEPAPPTAHPGFRSSLVPILGIDFGTSYSSIAVMRAGLEVVPDETGEPAMPTVISFPNPGEAVIGAEARNRMAGEAQFTIVSPKRLLGRLYKDPQVSQVLGGLAFRTFAGSDKLVRFEAHGEIYSVTDICAMILGKLRENACRYLGMEVRKAVFSVPVGFGTLQRSALEAAARQAGLEPVGLLTEPSAAVLSHGFRGKRGLVAVYDFGGGTFDFSVVEVSETAFQVLCAGGDNWLGGDDFDNAMANQLADRFWKETGVDLRNRAVEWQALVFACERAKRVLSNKSSAEIRIDNLLHTSKGSKGLRYKMNRKEFLQHTKGLIEKSVNIANQVMLQAGITAQHVDAVALTGGTSLIPAVRETVGRFFGKKPIKGDPDLAVVRGASLRAAELSGEAVAETSMGGRTLKEVAGRTIGAGPKGGSVVTLFERDTPLPAEIFKAFYTQYDGQTEMVIGLYEESKSRVDESRTIGHLRYKGLRPAPAGQGRIDFTFLLDEDGILHVTAMVEGKEYSKSIRLG